jgi:hypothetical protein
MLYVQNLDASTAVTAIEANLPIPYSEMNVDKNVLS